jgi:hypothetical protein
VTSALVSRLDGIARSPLYVWLLAVYPIALIAVLNRSQVSSDTVLLALAGGFAAATACVVAYRALLGSWHKAALCGAVTVALFYAFGPADMAIDAWSLAQSDRDSRSAGVADGAPLLLSVVWLAVLAATVAFVRAARDARVAQAARPLNLVTGLLVATVAVQSLSSPSARTVEPAVAASAAAGSQGSSPDVYYIILDGYARADVLARHYGHDNAPFLDTLRSKGFSINDSGYANYYWTFLSLASSLNMDYVPAIVGEVNPTSVDRRAAYESIRDNAVAEMLRSRGYRFVQLQSTWGATLANPHADKVIACGGGPFANEFFRTLVEASWLRSLRGLASSSLAECHRDNFASLAAVAREPGPKFVLAHFLVPHHPYLFDRQGNVLSDATIANQFNFQSRLWEKRDAYLEQLLYVNDAVLTAVSRIQQDSARSPVIVLQSDHGPQLNTGLTEIEQRRVRLANLAAFHLPGAPPDLIPQGDSPVNFFRRILSFYAGAELPPLPNRHFHSSYDRPFAFKDVTALLTDDAPVVSEAR